MKLYRLEWRKGNDPLWYKEPFSCTSKPYLEGAALFLLHNGQGITAVRVVEVKEKRKRTQKPRIEEKEAVP